MTRRWLPKSLTAQLLLVAITGLVLTQIFSIQIYRTERSEVVGQVNNRYTLLRLISVVRLLTDTPQDLHPELLRASRSENLMLRLQSRPLLPTERNPFYEARVRRELAYPDTLEIRISVEQDEGAPPPEMLRPQMKLVRKHANHPPREVRIYGTIELPNGKWLNFSSLSDAELPGPPFWGCSLWPPWWEFWSAGCCGEPPSLCSGWPNRQSNLAGGRRSRCCQNRAPSRSGKLWRHLTACRLVSTASFRTGPACWRPSPTICARP